MTLMITRKPPGECGGRRARGSAGGRFPVGKALAGACIFLASTLCLPPAAFTQSTPPQARALPSGFRSVSLGMGLDEVKQALKTDPLFRYRGDPDVSFLPQTNQYLIECDGNSYLRRAYFQFADSRLFIMILVLDTQKLDHFSLFSALSTKYGQPTTLNPQESVWQSDPVRFSLERPLTVKYVDNKTFSAILAKGGARGDLDQLSREKFIEQF
jgi:hypothetical protein